MFILINLVPAHLRHLVAAAIGLDLSGQLKLDDLTWNQAQPRRADTGRPFGTVVQQHLHAHTDTKQRLVRCGVQHRLQQARFGQLAHAVGHGALSRQHDPVRIQHVLGAGSDHDFEAAALGHVRDRLRHRTQIAHAVIDDSDFFKTCHELLIAIICIAYNARTIRARGIKRL